ncbi:MAG TPA: hypothetical protein VHW00_04715 [Thermoanaerobaculia bacterium]|nr:hypothetical protein [Thermoanaerobaculia bacterium]
MVVTLRVLIVWSLAQLASCAGTFCNALERPLFPARMTNLGRTADVDVMVGFELLEADEWLLVGTAEKSRVLLRFSENDGLRPLANIRAQSVGEGSGVDGDAWWYAIAGGLGNQWGAMFLQEQEPQSRIVPLPFAGTSRFVAVRGGSARGLYLYVDPHDGATRAIEVTPDGIQHRWDLAGRDLLTTAEFLMAVRREDESIALLVGEAERVTLKVLAANAAPGEFVLSEEPGFRYAAAANRREELLLVSESANRLRAIHVDLAKPDRIETIWLTGEQERSRFPTVAETDDGFVVAWIGGETQLRARTIAHGRLALLPMNVGPITRRGERRPFVAVRPSGDSLVFVWERGDDIVARTLPASSSGVALLTSVEARLCDRKRH